MLAHPFYILKPKNTPHLLRRSISLSGITNKQYYSTHFCINTCSISTDIGNNSHLGLYFLNQKTLLVSQDSEVKIIFLQISIILQHRHHSDYEILLKKLSISGGANNFYCQVCLFNTREKCFESQHNLSGDVAACSSKFNLPIFFKRQITWIL